MLFRSSGPAGAAWWLLLAAVTASESPEVPPLERGRALTGSFYDGETAALWARLSEGMREAVGSQDSLAAFAAQIRTRAGTEEAVLDERVEAQDGLHVYQRTARFSKAPTRVLVQWAFAPDGTVHGFFVRPVPEEPSHEQLDYVTRTELRLPFSGRWYVFWGGRSLTQNYHFGTVDQRFAYDILVRQGDRSHSGDGTRNEDYHCFDRPVLAPAAGTVVVVENDIPDNVPGVMNARAPMGNHVVLDHGNGEFSFLCHLRRETVSVKKGETVKPGTTLGRCGNSGNSSEPHLHYHLQDSPEFGKGRGLPAPFRHYQADGQSVDRGEPVKGQTISAP